jgi:hypothetical protein
MGSAGERHGWNTPHHRRRSDDWRVAVVGRRWPAPGIRVGITAGSSSDATLSRDLKRPEVVRAANFRCRD